MHKITNFSQIAMCRMDVGESTGVRNGLVDPIYLPRDSRLGPSQCLATRIARFRRATAALKRSDCRARRVVERIVAIRGWPLEDYYHFL